jgi:predicted PurR-regulated permease PerM
VAFNAAQILVVLVTVFFGVIFTLMNPRPIFGAFFLIVPERHHEITSTILQRVGKFVPTWAFATLLAMLTVGLLVFLLMWPFFGFVDALALGLFAGAFEAIPYMGPILSALPALLFALGEGGMTTVWVLLAYLAVQVLENNIISPLIMAHSMKLHSVAVIFSMLLCVAAFGVLGVLVAAPLVAIVDILHDELYRKRYLPTVTDADLDRLARNALREKPSVSK